MKKIDIPLGATLSDRPHSNGGDLRAATQGRSYDTWISSHVVRGVGRSLRGLQSAIRNPKSEIDNRNTVTLTFSPVESGNQKKARLTEVVLQGVLFQYRGEAICSRYAAAEGRHGGSRASLVSSVNLRILRGREKKCSADFQLAKVLLTQKELSRLRCRRDAGATIFSHDLCLRGERDGRSFFCPAPFN